MAAIPSTIADNISAAMRRTNDLFITEVFGNRNFSALEQIYTKEARILPPGAQMISGIQAITKFWSDLIQSANATAADLTSVDVIPAGDGLVEIGRATITMEPDGQSPAQL